MDKVQVSTTPISSTSLVFSHNVVSTARVLQKRTVPSTILIDEQNAATGNHEKEHIPPAEWPQKRRHIALSGNLILATVEMSPSTLPTPNQP